jgi:hypothetical protein
MTHIVYTSIAQRLDAGTYSTCIARRPVAPPTRPVASPYAGMATIVAPYVGSALLGALLALAYQVQP